MKFENMFSPIQIGPMEVKNRFVVPPMGNNFANTDGTMSDQSVAYYGARAKGGFGLITLEATVVHKGAKGGPRKPCLYDDSAIPSFKKVIDACHAEGAKVSIQLQNAGPEGNAKNAGAPIQAATAVSSADGRDIPEEVTTEQVYELARGYGEAARRAMEAGATICSIKRYTSPSSEKCSSILLIFPFCSTKIREAPITIISLILLSPKYFSRTSNPLIE